jgi:hypothetical protein
MEWSPHGFHRSLARCLSRRRHPHDRGCAELSPSCHQPPSSKQSTMHGIACAFSMPTTGEPVVVARPAATELATHSQSVNLL